MTKQSSSEADKSSSRVSIGDVQGGIQGAKIAGRDIIEIGEVKLNLTPIQAALGQPLPARNQSALLQTLRQALPHLPHPAEKLEPLVEKAGVAVLWAANYATARPSSLGCCEFRTIVACLTFWCGVPSDLCPGYLPETRDRFVNTCSNWRIKKPRKVSLHVVL